MKIFYTIALIIGMISSSLFASIPENGAEYYICHFSKNVSNTYLKELSKQGIKIHKTDSNQKMIYVTVPSNKSFTNELKSTMIELIRVDKNGNKTIVVENKKNSNSQLLNLFFNFI